MKRMYLAAGALLLGSSAIAWAADTDKSATIVKAAAVGAEMAKFAPTTAKATSWNEAGWSDEKALLASKPVGDDKLHLAALDKDLEPIAVAEAKTMTWAPKADDGMTGMGGPEEEVSTTSLTPALAAENYPPCSPGPGDDRCIQLYEPGVRAQLASWNHSTGGLAENSVTTAMGGPFEPVEADKVEVASVDTGFRTKIETAEVDSDVGVTSHDAYQGVGGPVEVQAGYPPCSPGPGDDRCIQLYERGVSGAGN